MKIVTRRSPSHTANVVARLQGEIPARIAFCAHYDSKVDTPGAYDNAAGVGCLLTLAEILSQKRHRHTLEWIAFTGEEGAGLGDMEYARQIQNRFDQITTLINIDGVGPFTSTTTVASYVASQPFESLLHEKMTRYPAIVKVEPWPSSDHYVFYSHGTPCLAFTGQGIRDIYHTLSDTFEWISGEKLEETIQLALDFIEELDQKDLAWSRPKK